VPTYTPGLFEGVGFHCTEIPAEDYWPLVEQNGKALVKVLAWIESLGY